MENRIIPECNFNTVMMEVLGFKNTNHIQGTSNIAVTLENKSYNNSVGIGVIDNDKPKRQTKMFVEKYKQIAKHGNLIIKQKPNTKKYIVMHPVSEKWIWEMIQDAGLNYGQNNFDTFKNECKHDRIKTNQTVKNILSQLKQKENEFKKLGEIINELLSK